MVAGLTDDGGVGEPRGVNGVDTIEEGSGNVVLS